MDTDPCPVQTDPCSCRAASVPCPLHGDGSHPRETRPYLYQAEHTPPVRPAMLPPPLPPRSARPDHQRALRELERVGASPVLLMALADFTDSQMEQLFTFLHSFANHVRNVDNGTCQAFDKTDDSI